MRISGVKFEIRKMNGEIVGQYTTDRNGTIRLPGLESGWYAVTELKAASGYQLDPTPQTVEVKDGQTATLELTNRKTSRVLIHKIDANTGKGIYGVAFLLYDSNHNPIGEYVSDQDGYVYMDDGLADGRYYVRNADNEENDTQSDYFFTHFALQMPKVPGGEVYLFGDLTNNRMDEAYKMEYNLIDHQYELVTPLKQGSYNYMYMYKRDGETKGLTQPCEGDFHQTENEYEVYVYHRPFGLRYDKLIGFQKYNYPE